MRSRVFALVSIFVFVSSAWTPPFAGPIPPWPLLASILVLLISWWRGLASRGFLKWGFAAFPVVAMFGALTTEALMRPSLPGGGSLLWLLSAVLASYAIAVAPVRPSNLPKAEAFANWVMNRFPSESAMWAWISIAFFAASLVSPFMTVPFEGHVLRGWESLLIGFAFCWLVIPAFAVAANLFAWVSWSHALKNEYARDYLTWLPSVLASIALVIFVTFQCKLELGAGFWVLSILSARIGSNAITGRSRAAILRDRQFPRWIP